MTEAETERAVLGALAAAGIPMALVEARPPCRVCWTNAAFAQSLPAGAPAEGRSLLEVLGRSEGLVSILEGLRDEGPRSLVIAMEGDRRRRAREVHLVPVE